MDFLLERFYGNSRITKGILTVPHTTFAAYTLEGVDPLYTKTRNKMLMALPEGTYRLKLVFYKTQYTLRLSLLGTYRQARFEQGEEIEDVAAGSVILGTGFDGDFKMKGSKEAMAMFGKFLDFQILCQGFGEHYNDITLTIRRTPDFVYEDKAAPFEGLSVGATNWNLIRKKP